MKVLTEQLRAALAQAAQEARDFDARTEKLLTHLAEKPADELRDEVVADPERHLRSLRSMAARHKEPVKLVLAMERAVDKALQAIEIEARLRASDDAMARLLANGGAVSPLARTIAAAIRPANDRPPGRA